MIGMFEFTGARMDLLHCVLWAVGGIGALAAVFAVWAFGYMLLAVSERPGNRKGPAVPPPAEEAG